MPKRRRAALWATLAGINLFVALICVTVLLEVFIHKKRKNTLAYLANPHFRQELKPDQPMNRDGNEFNIGSLGLRGPQPEGPKKAGTRRLFVMGGSSVFDHEAVPSWPERLQPLLAEEGLEGVETFNAGIPGFSSREVEGFFEHRIKAFEPDVVVLYLGWNDAKYMRPFLKGVKELPYPGPEAVEKAYRWLYSPFPLRDVYALPVFIEWGFRKSSILMENTFPKVEEEPEAKTPPNKGPSTNKPAPKPIDWDDSPGMQYFADKVQAIIDDVKAAGAKPILVAEVTLVTNDLPKAARKPIKYHWAQLKHEELVEINDLMASRLGDLAAKNQIPFIDLRDQMNGRPKYFIDHVHLTDEGSEALAKALAPKLVEALQPPPEADG